MQFKICNTKFDQFFSYTYSKVILNIDMHNGKIFAIDDYMKNDFLKFNAVLCNQHSKYTYQVAA